MTAITLPYVVGYSPRVPEILNRLGKRYISTPVPKGLPRYRTVGDCHRNCQNAVLADNRLTYVEGAAHTSIGVWMGHAWVTMDGVHAIDLTWRGQRARLFRKGYGKDDATAIMHPASEYVGVEIPTKDVAKFMVANGYHALFLDQWIAQREAA